MLLKKITTVADLENVIDENGESLEGATFEVSESLLRYPENALRGPEKRERRENLFTLANVNARGEEQNTYLNQEVPIQAFITQETESGDTETKKPVFEIKTGTQRTATARDIREDWIQARFEELAHSYMKENGLTEPENVPVSVSEELRAKAERETPHFYLRAEVIKPPERVDALLSQINENYGRIKQNPAQMGKVFANLLQNGIPISKISEKNGLSKDKIFSFMKLNKLPDYAREAVDNGKITISAGLLMVSNMGNVGAKLDDDELREIFLGASSGDTKEETERKIELIKDRKKMLKNEAKAKEPEFIPPSPSLSAERAEEIYSQVKYRLDQEEEKEGDKELKEAFDYIFQVSPADYAKAEREHKEELEAFREARKKQAEKK